MWLVWFNKKRDVNVDLFVYAVFTGIKPGLGKSTCEFANKKEGPYARSIFVSFSLSKPPEPGWLWRLFSAYLHL